MSSTSNPLAELTAMRAKGEITPQEFKLAKQYLDEEMKQYQQAQPTYKMRDFWLGLAFIGVVVGGVYYAGSSIYTVMQRTPEEIAAYEAKKAKDAQEAARIKAEQAELALYAAAGKAAYERRAAEKVRAEACFNYYGNTNKQLYQMVENAMHNPDSFKVVNANYSIGYDGTAIHRIRYRGTNGFGAVVTETVTAKINTNTCSVIDVLH